MSSRDGVDETRRIMGTGQNRLGLYRLCALDRLPRLLDRLIKVMSEHRCRCHTGQSFTHAPLVLDLTGIGEKGLVFSPSLHEITQDIVKV